MADIDWPDLYFIRHGETPWNAERRYQGRQDIPLNAVGRAQAARNGVVLARTLAERGLDPAGMDWHASPLTRTRETVALVREAFAMSLPEVKFDLRLVEISFGALEGMLQTELPAHLATATGERDASYWDFRPERGENYRDVEARLRAFADVLNGPAIVVAHGGIARTLRVLIEGAEIAEVINWAPPQDVIMHFKPGMMETIAG